MLHDISKQVFASLFIKNVLFPATGQRFSDAMMLSHFQDASTPVNPNILKLNLPDFIDRILSHYPYWQTVHTPTVDSRPTDLLALCPEFSDEYPVLNSQSHSMLASMTDYLNGRPMIVHTKVANAYYPIEDDPFWTDLSLTQRLTRQELWQRCFFLPPDARAYFKARRDYAVTFGLRHLPQEEAQAKLNATIDSEVADEAAQGPPVNLFESTLGALPELPPGTMEKLSEIFKSDFYFWVSKAVQMASARKDSVIDYAIVSNDIMMRYADHVIKLGSLFTKAIVAAVKALFDVISGVMNSRNERRKFMQAVADEDYALQAEDPDPVFCPTNTGFDSAKSFFTTGSTLFKYMQHKGAFKEFSKLLAIGVLGGLAYASNNPTQFSLANLEALWTHALSTAGAPSLYAVAKIMTTMYETIRSYQDAPVGTTFVSFIRSCVAYDAQLVFAQKLIVQYESWGILDIELQIAWKEEAVAFMSYAEETLGAKKGWMSGKVLLKGPRRPILTTFQNLYERISIGYIALSHSGPRMAPFCIVLQSGSSTGKSFQTELLEKLILGHHLKIPADKHAESVFVWNGLADHMDGFTNGTQFVVLDDVGALHPKLYEAKGGDPQLSIGIELVNNVAFNPKMASLVDKGRIFGTPKCVCVTSNVRGLGLDGIFVHPAVMKRRFKNFVDVTLRPDFKTVNNTLDEKKLIAWNTANPGKVCNAWNFQVEVIKVHNQDGHVNKITTVSERMPKMDTYQFMTWVSKSYEEHMAGQLSFMKAAKAEYDWSFVDAPRPIDPDGGILPDLSQMIDITGPSDDEIEEEFYDSDAFGDPDAYVPQAPDPEPNLSGYDAMCRTFSEHRKAFMAIFTVFVFLGAFADQMIPMFWSAYAGVHGMFERVHENLTSYTRVARVMAGVVSVRDTVMLWLQVCLASMGTVGYFLFMYGLSMGAGLLIKKLCKKAPPIIEPEAPPAPAKKAKPDPILIPEHDADARARYFPPLGGANTTLVLSKHSKSIHGATLSELVAKNCCKVTFTSGLHDKYVAMSLFSGKTVPSRDTYGARATFMKGEWAAMNAHYIPRYCRRNSPGWDDGWKATFHGAGPAGTDVTIDKTAFMRHCKFIEGRDLILLRVNGVELKRNITNWLIPAPVTYDSKTFGTASVSMMTDQDGAPSYTRGVVSKTYVGNDPFGELHVESDEQYKAIFVKASHVKLHIPVTTKGGDCGLPVFGMDGETYRYILGIHAGADNKVPHNKVATPIFYDDMARCVNDAPMHKTFVIREPETPPERYDTDDIVPQCSVGSVVPHIDGCFTRGYEGFNKPKGDWVRVHNEMELEPGIWGLRNEQYIFESTGLKVNPNSYVELGCYKPGIGGNLTSDYYDSPCASSYRALNWIGLPGPIDTNKVVANLNRTERNKAAALATGVLMSHEDDDPVMAECLMKAAEAVFREFSANEEIFDHIRPYDLDVAINGRRASVKSLADIPNDQPFLRGCEPLQLATSAGWPWLQAGFGSGKSPWLDQEDDGRRVMGPALQAQYDELLAKMAEVDVETKFIFRMCPKDEPISQAKREKCKVRMIMVSPLEASILMRQYLMCFCRVMAIFPFTFSSMVGVDATSKQWSQIHGFVAAPGMSTWDGDYQDFDKNMRNMVILAVLWIFASLILASNHYSRKDQTVATGLLKALSSPVIDVFGVLYWVAAMNSSGNTITTQFGCIANNVYITHSFFTHLKIVLHDEFDYEFAERLMRAVMRKAMYGDDNLVGCIYDDVFDCIAMQSCLANLIVYTDAKKSVNIEKFTPRDELQFLGRTFVEREDGRVIAPLEWARITKMIMFYRKLPGLDFANVVNPVYRAALMEAYFHGREVYDLFFHHMVGVLGGHFGLTDEDMIIDMFLSHSGGRLTWDFFDDWYESRADSGWIDDPRFVEAMEASDAAQAYAEFCQRRARAQRN